MSSTFWHAIVALVAASYYMNSWPEKAESKAEAVVNFLFAALALYLFAWAVDGMI